MNRFLKCILLCAMCLLVCCGALPVGAVSAAEKLQEPDGGLLAVSFRGDTSAAPANSFDAVIAAADAGADLISVEVTKTADNSFLLLTDAQLSALPDVSGMTFDQVQTALYGAMSAQLVTTLSAMVASLGDRAMLIVDFDWADRAALCAHIEDIGAENRVLLRAAQSAEKILKFKDESATSAQFLGVYRGNVVMHANAYLKKFSQAGASMVQYQNKNYFCVSYQTFTTRRFGAHGNPRALISMVSKDLCGQREDNVTGWDDMISRGFSAVETNNIADLAAYIRQTERSKTALQTMLDTALAMDTGLYSSLSVKTLEKAEAAAQAALAANASLSARQAAASKLQNALRALTAKTENDTQKGALQITAGKIIVIAVFALAVIAAQVYVYKMKRRKGEDYHA